MVSEQNSYSKVYMLHVTGEEGARRVLVRNKLLLGGVLVLQSFSNGV
jgi:hypothetical protein